MMMRIVLKMKIMTVIMVVSTWHDNHRSYHRQFYLSIYPSIYLSISYQSLIPQYSQMPSSSPHLDVHASFDAFPSTNQCV